MIDRKRWKDIPAELLWIDTRWLQWLNYYSDIAEGLEDTKMRICYFLWNFPWSAISKLSETQAWEILKRISSLWLEVLNLVISKIKWSVLETLDIAREEAELFSIKRIIQKSDINYLKQMNQLLIAAKLESVNRRDFSITPLEDWSILIDWTSIIFSQDEINILQWIYRLD